MTIEDGRALAMRASETVMQKLDDAIWDMVDIVGRLEDQYSREQAEAMNAMQAAIVELRTGDFLEHTAVYEQALIKRATAATIKARLSEHAIRVTRHYEQASASFEASSLDQGSVS